MHARPRRLLCAAARRPPAPSRPAWRSRPRRRVARIARKVDARPDARRIGDAMSKKRVHEIAKEQGLSSKELLEKLSAAGIDGEGRAHPRSRRRQRCSARRSSRRAAPAANGVRAAGRARDSSRPPRDSAPAPAPAAAPRPRRRTSVPRAERRRGSRGRRTGAATTARGCEARRGRAPPPSACARRATPAPGERTPGDAPAVAGAS